jgi:hypothetical protein
MTNSLRIKLPLSHIAAAVGRVIQGKGFRLSIAPTRLPTIEEQREVEERGETEAEVSVGGNNEEGNAERRTFCPALYRDSIINMMEKHYCAHPSIPGYGPPDAIGIKRWAVQQIYNFCLKHELPELWVYLWENWYRRGRWELWARSAHALIPVLKTTMILESQ